MSNHDDDRPENDGVSESTSSRSENQRRKIVIGALGAAAVLGAGAYLITAQVVDQKDSTATQDAGALAPLATPASSDPAPSVEASGAPSSAAPGPAKKLAAATPAPLRSKNVNEEIKAAQQKAAKDGYPVQRALTAAPNAKTGPVSERSEKRQNGVLRIITAKHDLTGQRELLWPADGGEKVGSAECTQTFKFANNATASKRPTLLLCWRTSAGKSVVTVLVDRTGKPSTAESVKVIDQEWAKLG